jgi:hypothetical protein
MAEASEASTHNLYISFPFRLWRRSEFSDPDANSGIDTSSFSIASDAIPLARARFASQNPDQHFSNLSFYRNFPMVINSEQCLSLALGDYEKDLIY